MTAILVVLTILAAVTVDIVLTKLRHRQAAAGQELPIAAMVQPRPPQGIFLDTAHSCVRITTDGALRVGIDDFLAEALGEPEAVEAPPRGTQVKRGDPLLRLRVKGHTVVVPAPAAGEVIALNERVTATPWMVSRDPYGVGWIVALWTRDHHEAIRPLRIGSAAGAFLRHELQRFADFLTPAGTPATVPLLADGGVPRKGVLATLDEGRLAAFQRDFLGGEEA